MNDTNNNDENNDLIFLLDNRSTSSMIQVVL